MERGGEEAAAARTNGPRSSNQLLVKQEGRKPLFANNNGPRDRSSGRAQESPRPKTARLGAAGAAAGGRAEASLGLVRRTKSESQTLQTDRQDSSGNGDSNASLSSPGGTRIPRPSSSAFHKRRPISLSEAFRLAEEEELEARRAQAMDGSPSPAPRPWRARGGQDETKLRQMLGEDHLDTKVRNTNGASAIPDLVPGIQDVPLPSTETEDRGLGPSPRRNAENKSPEKSFAWQVDEDFTARDLQVSDSPRIKVGSNRPFANRPSLVAGNDRVSIRSPARLAQPASRSTKLDEREHKMSSEVLSERSRARQRNTKLDEIRAREKAAEQQIGVPARNPARPKNTKLDEIRQREAEGLSKRAYAASRLEEIREQNSMSRSLSPDEVRPHPNREPQRATLVGADRKTEVPIRPKSAFEAGGERIPDTPITVFKSYRNTEGGPGAAASDGSVNDLGSTAADPGKRDSYDLLRRLARATSSSPAPEAGSKQQPAPPRNEDKGDKQMTKPVTSERPSENGSRTARGTRNARDNSNPKPTVGFAGLQREDSGDSAKSKRSSMQSEMDPTDRIEAEMKLFALHDNHSERGSVRAPSPQPDSDEDDDEPAEATPRPQKHDPLSMPTPRVTGAYVETPATVKAGKRGDSQEESKPAQDEEAKVPAPAMFRAKRTRFAWRSRDNDTASDPGASDEKDGDALTTAAATRRRPRARSLPRRRPPLKNTARPPSVKADLLELQRIHKIDDSTMDDLEEILTGRKTASPKLEQLLKQLPAATSTDDDLDVEPKLKLERESSEEGTHKARKEAESAHKDVSEGELALYDRMSRTLRTGLLGIRSAKQGIERLEDQFSHAGKQSPDTMETQSEKQHTHQKHAELCPACIAQPNPTPFAYVHLAVPRLYHAAPRFRLTLLGLVLLLLSLWGAAESAMCARYCRPTTCSTAECVYSFDDPTFGSALPVKLDQWTTGGHGRQLFVWAAEEVQDWAADLQDAALGQSMADVSLEGMSFEQKRQHRRRLHKKGLATAAPEPPPEQKAKWEAWRRTRLAQERAREVREMGYHDAGDEYGEGGAIGRDERVW
ncbi:hypothetical protein TOPH_05806 [Tolypocladium ophioglossoides CBS 100239]|uniref:Uncharacterized protein n=1 Tax=Tolypocladium ophioglossoides (strain CBS 100239) TaxID=1163406 RepID=A0A0L0N5X2_TOLOC|nr:hypothetical protein TOPH_05806 [Tolypocladium ophioglossoides CBS 100239]